jgi:hypothetical protein
MNMRISIAGTPLRFVTALLLGFLLPSPAGARVTPSGEVPDAGAILHILPPPTGMDRMGEISIYPIARLADYIDGAAEVYKEYGVMESATVAFGPAGAQVPRITIDLHHTYEAKNAFGLFRLEKGDAAESLDIGAESAWQSGLLTFWRGPYYVRIVSEAGLESTLGCARTLDAILPTGMDSLVAMGFFPRATIEGTERWVPRSYLGIRGLDDIWTATCKDTAGTFDVLFRKNRPPLREADVGKAGKIVSTTTDTSPIQMIRLEQEEKGKILILFYRKLGRYVAGYVGPKPNDQRTTFISKWADVLPTGH